MTTIALLGTVWMAATYRIWITLRRPDLASVSFTIATVLVAMSFTIRAARHVINASIGSPNLAELLRHILLVTAALLTQVFLLALRHSALDHRALRLRVGPAVVVAIALTTLFWLAPIHQTEAGASLDADFGTSGVLVIYRLILAGYLAYCLIDNSRLCWKYRRAPGDEVRSASLILIGTGCGIAAITAVGTAVLVLNTYLDGPDWLNQVIVIGGSASAVIAVVTLAAGILTPGLAVLLLRAYRARQLRRHLDPLWTRLTKAVPDVVLRARGGGTPVQRAELVAARRRLEILDVLPAVRLTHQAASRIRSSPEPAEATGVEIQRGNWHLDPHAGIALSDILTLPADPDDELAALNQVATGYRQGEQTPPTPSAAPR